MSAAWGWREHCSVHYRTILATLAIAIALLSFSTYIPELTGVSDQNATRIEANSVATASARDQSTPTGATSDALNMDSPPEGGVSVAITTIASVDTPHMETNYSKVDLSTTRVRVQDIPSYKANRRYVSGGADPSRNKANTHPWSYGEAVTFALHALTGLPPPEESVGATRDETLDTVSVLYLY
ncbi:hypothetical protein SARC_09373 [Sphaeroforma arctica JP610]|uniref:Uncharacterized protein n=1 Tax=Sphaeroforma arctica JP610 TaxID=667725 RepID=A0A0L0FN33_9EUKA|nr:hypothetical protein SARC_09373 [Sphaeroforma arctica JP610]KNC78190.1 hypothetical protein SARC_09373 [Sphaeroforma arctica JP610]|eukprot:XP_014152092.1 hypothetical protein SARC_09373 [Sphaeroforma arctica JP610]